MSVVVTGAVPLRRPKRETPVWAWAEMKLDYRRIKSGGVKHTWRELLV